MYIDDLIKFLQGIKEENGNCYVLMVNKEIENKPKEYQTVFEDNNGKLPKYDITGGIEPVILIEVHTSSFFI